MITVLTRETPNNPDILAKAAYIHFGCIDLINPDVGIFNDAKKYLGTLIRIKSNHPDKESLAKQSSIIDGAIRLVNTRSLIRKNGNDPDMLVAAIRTFFLYLNTQQFNEEIFMEAFGLLQRLIQIDPEHKDIFVLQSQEERIRKKHSL